jgi:hypothetical protein
MKQMKQLAHEEKAQIFHCKICDYNTSYKSKFDRHLLTGKHKILTNETKKGTQGNSQTLDVYACEICKKNFNSRTTMWRHKKECSPPTITTSSSNTNTNENKEDIAKLTALITQLMTQNTELIKKIGGTTNNTINNNTNNTNNTNTNINKSKNFNIQFFLNETCKDALNISEFVDSLKITLEDLDFSRKNGLVSGITDVMIKGLKQLDVTKRPIHCTDKKRETMYIKDNAKWEKDETHEKMKNTKIQIAKKERNALTEWVEENPDWMETESKQIEYLTIMRNVCEPIEEYDKNNKKIIRTLTSNVFVDK